MKNVDICFLTDEGYAMQTCIALTSILKNKKNNIKYNIYILCNKVSNDSLEKIKSLDKVNFNINIIELKNNDEYIKYDIKDIPASPTAIYKFNIPQILNKLDKVLYLDGDIIVNEDLSELFNYDIGDNYLGAVKDTAGLSKSLFKLFIKKNIFYFNSGVMIMNLKKMREDKVTELLIDYRINGYNELMDQDALNFVLRNKVCELPFKFNTQLMFAWINNNVKELKEYFKMTSDLKSTKEIINNAVIVHYSGMKKPWKHYDGFEHDLWVYYYYLSPFNNNMLNRCLYHSNINNNKFTNFIKKKQKNLRRYKFMKKFIKN